MQEKLDTPNPKIAIIAKSRFSVLGKNRSNKAYLSLVAAAWVVDRLVSNENVCVL